MRRPNLIRSAAFGLPLALAGALASPALAAGFHIQEQSVEALGRAYSGEAAGQGADELWWNPSAIAGLGWSELYSGLQTIQVHGNVTDQGSTIQPPGYPSAVPVGGARRVHDPVPTGYVPNFDAAMRLSDQWTLGLAVSAPFDFVSKYADSDWTRYSALTSRLTDIDVQPTVGWRPMRWLRLGAGLDAQYVDAYLTSALPNPVPGAPDGAQTLDGHGWNFGYVVGAQADASRVLTFGASWRSGISHRLDGTAAVGGLIGPAAPANFQAPAQAAFDTPWILTGGLRARVSERLDLDLQVQRFGWSRFSAIQVTYAGGGMTTPERYHDTTDVSVGGDYRLTRQLTMRAGVEHDPTPTPDQGRDPRVPDGDRWLYSLGASFTPTRAITFDLGAGYYQFQRAHVDTSIVDYAGTPLATPVSLVGEVTGAGLVLSAGAHLRF